MKARKKNFALSEELWKKAERLIPAGMESFSKGHDRYVAGVAPKFLMSGKGAHIWDVDGNEYIDFSLAFGPILLGYDYPAVSEAVIRQVRKGTALTLRHPLEVDVAELLTSIIPSAEMVRFGNNGSDVRNAAIKLARACTGRDHIAYSGFQGWRDRYAVTTHREKGIPGVSPKRMHEFGYNDFGSLEAVFSEHTGEVACAIMQVPSLDPAVDPKTGLNFLVRAKELAHRNGALLILDELVTGFRYSTGGAQKLYTVAPDLSCFGKGMANGYPISALVGKKEFMKELNGVSCSMIDSGNSIGLAAARATIMELLSKPVLSYIWKMGERLHVGVNEAAVRAGVDLKITGKPPMECITVRNEKGEEDLLLKSIFMQEIAKRGVLLDGPVFVSYSHNKDDIDKTINASAAAMAVLKEAAESGDAASFLEDASPAADLMQVG